MKKVVGVRFKKAGKVYYFGPGNFPINVDDRVIVETSRGVEMGFVTMKPTDVNDDEIVQPLKDIIRIATDDDIAQYEENIAREAKALSQCQEKIDKHGLDMKLVDVEYTFDNSKVIFYFTADGRVDFRELVRDLASVFHTRIELRQIGVRDEAKMLGGIANCGKSLCCHSWISDFEPVSIKMAKIQGLSLNPAKISGVCGRLMCCLKYENDTYIELRKGMPDVGERIKTPDGNAVVVETNILESKVNVRLIEGKEVNEEGIEEEVLSNDIYTFRKDEIKRRKKNGKNHKGSSSGETEVLSEEMKDLLKD